jgi:hypothetical protein
MAIIAEGSSTALSPGLSGILRFCSHVTNPFVRNDTPAARYRSGSETPCRS